MSAAAARAPLAPLAPLLALGDGTLAALRRRLAEVGYDDALLAQAEAVAPRQLDAVRLPLVHAWLRRRGGPGSGAAALFAYAATLPPAEVGAALGAELALALEAAGGLGPAGGGLAARLRLVPLDGLLVLSDPPEGGPEAAMGPGPTTLTLARLVPRSPGAVLDLGCGAGTLSLLAAARGAGRAVGVDLSARAVGLSRLNARLNGSAAAFREGDLLGPVAGERFDLVVSQPPYVVRPPGVEAVTYLHGGPLGEELALRFLAAVPAVLAPAGRALLHFDAPVLPGRPLLARARQALGSADVDLLLLAATGPSPDLQAAAYAALEDPDLGPRYREAALRYRAHLVAAGVEAFSRALAVVRPAARPGAGLSVLRPVPSLDRLEPADLDRLLAGVTLAGAPEDRLLAARVAAAPGARLEEVTALDGSAPPVTTLRFARGAAADQAVSEAALVLLTCLASADDVAGAVARFAATGPDRPGARAEALAAVRDLLARGVLAPSG